MRTLEILFLLCFLFLLTGCISPLDEEQFTSLEQKNSKEQSIPSSSGILPSTEPNDSVNDNTFCVSFRPIEFSPELIITITRIDNQLNEDLIFPLWSYYCTVSQANKELQSFKIESNLDLESSHIEFIDMDFDGYLDMSIVIARGVSNSTCDYYRYIADKSIFEETPFFRATGVGDFFPDTKQIITTVRSSAVFYERDMYHYTDGKYVHARRETADWKDYGSGNIILRIMEIQNDVEYFATEIFSTTITESEYYGDRSIRDNYLRFGSDE